MKLVGRSLFKATALSTALLLPGTSIADVVSVPFGTRVFIELDQQVTSKKKHNQSGSFVQAHVWRDVVVDRQTVVQAGTPVMVQIGDIKPAKVAGVKGQVELRALQVSAVDGADLMLTGGYDQSGKSLTALSVTLAVVVFVPLIFLKGKQAKLEPGTVFDATVAQPAQIEIPAARTETVKIRLPRDLEVTVLYEILEQQGEKKTTTLPLFIQLEGKPIESARVISVNGAAIEPIPVEIDELSTVGERTNTATGTVDLKALGKHFGRGFNEFTVEVGEDTAEVMLDLEL